MPYPRKSIPRSADHVTAGFTLIEVLVSMTILLILMVMLAEMISAISRTYDQSTRIIDALQGARAGFDRMTNLLSQATLNPYSGYDDPNTPTVYLRQSDLAFDVLQNGSNAVSGDNTYGTGTGDPSTGAGTGHAVFFQVPIGRTLKTDFQALSQTLCSVGFGVRWVSDEKIRPAFFANPATFRLRLMQYVTLSENLTYSDFTAATKLMWIDAMAGSNSPAPGNPASTYQYPVADNIIWMAIWPKVSTTEVTDDPTTPSIAPHYVYNSRTGATLKAQPLTANQLPPIAQVTMIAIDEKSAARFAGTTFLTQVLPQFNGTLAQADATDFQTDLAKCTTALAAAKVNYRVFTTSVQMRESRWSQ